MSISQLQLQETVHSHPLPELWTAAANMHVTPPTSNKVERAMAKLAAICLSGVAAVALYKSCGRGPHIPESSGQLETHNGNGPPLPAAMCLQLRATNPFRLGFQRDEHSIVIARSWNGDVTSVSACPGDKEHLASRPISTAT